MGLYKPGVVQQLFGLKNFVGDDIAKGDGAGSVHTHGHDAKIAVGHVLEGDFVVRVGDGGVYDFAAVVSGTHQGDSGATTDFGGVANFKIRIDADGQTCSLPRFCFGKNARGACAVATGGKE